MATTVTLLDEILAYRHPGVVRRYAKEHGASLEEAQEIFMEMLRWLYLCDCGTRDGASIAMTPEIAKLDEMWHTFILFTRDYADFCERYFGVFLHHVPELEDDAAPAAAEDDAMLSARLERHFGLVYDVLGEETLQRWYEECRYAKA